MLKLITYNIESGLQQDLLAKNIKAFERDDVNIICLQEVRKNSGKPFIGDLFLQSLGEGWQGEFYSDPEYNNSSLALGILWNVRTLQFLGAERVMLPILEYRKWWEKLWERIVRGHLAKNSWFAFLESLGAESPVPQRGALIVQFKFGDKHLRVSNTHLDWSGGVSQRLKQIGYLAEHLRLKLGPEKEIICGDFNTLGMFRNFERRSQQIQNYLPPGFFDALVNPKATARPFQRLDYIFAKGFEKFSCEIVNIKGSDHLPLKATLG